MIIFSMTDSAAGPTLTGGTGLPPPSRPKPPPISSRQTGSAPPPGECQAPSRVLSASASGARAGNHGAEAERPGPRMKFLARARPSGGLHPDASARQRNSWKVPPRSPRVTADQGKADRGSAPGTRVWKSRERRASRRKARRRRGARGRRCTQASKLAA